MRKILLIAFFYCAVVISVTANDTIPASNNLIEYTGRIDFSNPEAPKFSYSGVSIRASFSGTSISAILEDDKGENYFNVIIDGVVVKIIHVTAGKNTYLLADSLDDDIHEIELFKRTELEFGKTTFHGFILDSGKTLMAITNNRNVFIEYIGNSITCGYGNEGVNGGTFGPTTENHFLTYAAITSRNFNARHMAVSRSGIGIYRNYGGPATGSDECMTNLYTRTFLYDASPIYSFEVQPDLVCINLGTNDFSTSGADSALYVDNYFRLIDTIQTKYTNPEIVCLVGSMMSGDNLNTIKTYLQFIADSASSKGKGRVSFFEMSAQTGDLGIGIDYHPTVAQHKKNALELTAYIKELKSWNVVPAIISSELVNAKHIQLNFNENIIDTENEFDGFSISVGDNNIDIDSIYQDATNKNILHIKLKQGLIPQTQINLQYTPGTIQSEDGVKVGNVKDYEIANNLTTTEITTSYIKSDGTYVKFSFNKKMNPELNIEGLIINANNNSVQIDSLLVNSKYLFLYLHTAIINSDVVTASYSGNGITGIDEVPLLSFDRLDIENTSNYTNIQVKVLENLTFFPNPNSTGIFSYKFSSEFPNVLFPDYEIVGINGALLKTGTLSGNQGTINLSENSKSGVYFIRLIADETVYSKSLIVNSKIN